MTAPDMLAALVEQLKADLVATMRMHEEQRAENARLRGALAKIDEIRNSIVGRQAVNWSAHIYPLVSALAEAGFDGEGYDVARQKALAEHKAIKAVFDERDRLAAQLLEDGPVAAAARAWAKSIVDEHWTHRSEDRLADALYEIAKPADAEPKGGG